MLTILKQGYRIVVLLLVMGLGLGLTPAVRAAEGLPQEDLSIPQPVFYSEEELPQRITETYRDAKTAVGYRSFRGRCSSMVNGSVIALGLHDAENRGDGRDIYDRYKDLGRTSSGYDIVCYDGGQYDLAGALRAVSDEGTREVYNLIVGWESGITASSSAYGHACFIHGIVDGKVYFSESFSLELNRTYYTEGEPIVCTIEEFAGFYDKWAYFEGLIHFECPDEEPPMLTVPILRQISRDGFTLSVRATDNFGVTELYAQVWHEGQTQEEALTIPLTAQEDIALLTVSRDAFDGFDGRYYVQICAADRKGNACCVYTSLDGAEQYIPKTPADPWQTLREEAGQLMDAVWEWFSGQID